MQFIAMQWHVQKNIPILSVYLILIMIKSIQNLILKIMQPSKPKKQTENHSGS